MREFFYELYTPTGNKLLKIKSKILYKIVNNVLIKLLGFPYDILLYKKLDNLKKTLIENENVYILHYSGRSLPKLYTENLFLN